MKLNSSQVYNILVRTHSKSMRFGGLWARQWWKAWEKACKQHHGAIKSRLHGHEVILNFGNTYPLNSRRFWSYNNPLVELIYQTYLCKKSPITYVDVGAATGDSILLVHANCPDMIGTTYAVDGDEEFFSYLENNVAQIPGVKLRKTLLSASASSVRSLLRTHGGTASAQGEELEIAVTLDSVVALDAINQVDVLKIDVDGFDGQVLLGSSEILTRDKPAVIFEWHPILCKQSGNNWTDHFEFLAECGYQTFLWYTKYGEFSHFAHGVQRETNELLADYCFQSKVQMDLHYDVIALHEASSLSLVGLADLVYASQRPSHY